jgi:hypothetical protein
MMAGEVLQIGNKSSNFSHLDFCLIFRQKVKAAPSALILGSRWAGSPQGYPQNRWIKLQNLRSISQSQT